MFDFHIHIARLPHSKQLTQLLLDRNYDFIAIACEPREWRVVTQLKKEFSSGLKPFKASYGIHPMIATQVTDEMLAKLRTLLEEDKRAIVGEAGIDKRFPGYEDGSQDEVFLAQAKLALELKRHLQIHCVGNYMRVLKLLEKAGYESDALTDLSQTALQNRDSSPDPDTPQPPLQKMSCPIFHRFGGDLSVVKKALPYGALFSLHADSFRKKSTVAAIPHIPQERVFFETDADETFWQGSTDKNVMAGNASTDPGTGSGMTAKDEAGMTAMGKAGNVVMGSATTDPGTHSVHSGQAGSGMTSPESIVAEIVAELESRLESVRLAYAKCRE
jgi:TatD DNase family protein